MKEMVKDDSKGFMLLIELFKEKGYDGFVYKNTHEDKGSLTYMIFSSEQVTIHKITTI